MKKYTALLTASFFVFFFTGSVAFAQSPLTESFDTYNTAPWSTFGGGPKNFDFTSGTNGECVLNGCITSVSTASGITRIFKLGDALDEGAFTVHARAKQGSGSAPVPRISICKGPAVGCAATRIDFSGLPLDDTWHEYLVLWRQGATVETCTLRDSLDQDACTWVASPVTAGSVFDGIALWSTNSYRPDLGATLSFDEINSVIVVDLTTTAPATTNNPVIGLEAHFSDGVTGFDLADITVDNGTASNLVEVTPDTYTFDVTAAADGDVVVDILPGAAEDSSGNKSIGAAAVERAVDTTGPSLTIVNKTTNELSPVMVGTVGESASTTLTVNAVAYPADVVGSDWSATIPEGTLLDGTYEAVASAADSLGNMSYATGTLVIDRTGPTLTITSGPAEGSVTGQNSVTFIFTTDGSATCKIDNEVEVPCSGSHSASGLTSGTHVFVVESTDTVGNKTSITRTWNIDTAAPVVTEVLAVSTPTQDTTPDYIFNSTKAGSITYGGGCSSATTVATVGDNAITFNELAPGTYSACTIAVTDSAGHASVPLAVSIFTIETPPPAETTVTLSALSDTYLRKGASNTNEGASPIIRIRAAGDNRGLVKFDQAAIEAAIGDGELLSASLEFTIEEAKNNWGKQGREVGAHRMLMNWIEGNGKVGELPGKPNRGTGLGATWDCAKDTNITNHKSDCANADDWEMRIKKTNPSERPWTDSYTDSTFIQKRQEGVVAFDITADVQKFLNGTPNYGWVIRKAEENRAGYVTFYSKESSGAAPELILTVRN
ncbi:DNRLRE domain-containing protein [Candidatus Nomurabacteria bacterium]|nr:DNRLRE domain-containing protein [Candidatus Nomurabacteria bacterium]